jgi:hypothetical protein
VTQNIDNYDAKIIRESKILRDSNPEEFDE